MATSSSTIHLGTLSVPYKEAEYTFCQIHIRSCELALSNHCREKITAMQKQMKQLKQLMTTEHVIVANKRANFGK